MKRHKKLLCILLLLVQIISNINFLYADSSKTSTYSIISFNEYISWLQNESVIYKKNGDINTSEQTDNYIIQLKALPNDKQNEFMERLYKPETWDVVTTNCSSDSYQNRAGEYWWFHVWTWQDFYLFGLNLLRLQQEIKFYHYYGQKIDYIYYHDAYTVFSYHPSAVLKTEYKTTYTTNNNTQANGECRISAHFVATPINIQTHNFYSRVWGNVYNNYGYSWWE